MTYKGIGYVDDAGLVTFSIWKLSFSGTVWMDEHGQWHCVSGLRLSKFLLYKSCWFWHEVQGAEWKKPECNRFLWASRHETWLHERS